MDIIDENDDGLDDPTSTRHPAHLKAYDALQQEGLLEYGAIIPWDFLEEVIGAPRTTMRFRGPFMVLTQILRDDHQFYLTEQGMRGVGVRIRERNEMHVVQQERLRRQRDQNLAHARCLSLVNTDAFTATERIGHERVTEQTGLTALFQHRILSAKELPSPDALRDNLRDLLK